MSETAQQPARRPSPMIDIQDPSALAHWAERLGVHEEAVRNAVIAVGPDSEAVALRLKSARGAAD